MATGPGPRIADADREAAAAHLREHYAQGRLTLEEFHHRLDAVFEATTQSRLTAITRDLPGTSSPAPLPPTATGNGRERAGRGHRPGSRARLGVIPVIDLYVHAWDLGVAVGIAVEIPADVIDYAHGYIDPLPDEMIRSDNRAFGPQIRVPPSATQTERFIAWTGRRPPQ